MSARRRTVIARPLADLSEVFGAGGADAFVSFGFAGEWTAARRDSSEAAYVEQGGARFPKSSFETATGYEVVRFREHERVQSVRIRGERTAFYFAAPHPSGVLMVGARCLIRDRVAEQNAALYSWQGDLIRRFTLGDGIQDVRVAPSGKIWASYFDEGVFGNFGWGHHRSHPPIGQNGLVRFDDSGHIEWQYDASTAGTDSICDAYAFNLASDEEAWTYFYTEFPIVRVASGAYRVWTQEHRGASGIAIRGDLVLLAGDYKVRNAARILRLSSSTSAEVVAKDLRIVTADGQDISAPVFVGVGPRLYVVHDRRVSVVDEW